MLRYKNSFLVIIALVILTGFSTLSQVKAVSSNSTISLNKNNELLLTGFSEPKIDIVVGQSLWEQKQITKKAIIKTNDRDVITRVLSNRIESPSPEEKRSLVKQIAQSENIDWKILEAVWEVESGKSWDRNVHSYAGAQGPMQFLPSTFRKYAQSDANINSAKDSLSAGAKLLAAAGASSGNIDKALFAYNHSGSYVAKVKRIASSIKD